MNEEIYEMQKWNDHEIIDELSRPTNPSDVFQYNVLREAIRRLLKKQVDNSPSI